MAENAKIYNAKISDHTFNIVNTVTTIKLMTAKNRIVKILSNTKNLCLRIDIFKQPPPHHCNFFANSESISI